MHGNTPHDGPAAPDFSPEDRRALRRDLVDVATSTRDLLSDDFVVGGEISDDNGLHATVAVQPPAGSVVSAGFAPEGDAEDVESLARELAAGAVLEAKHAAQDVSRAAR